MVYTVVMLLGGVIGYFLVSAKQQAFNNKLQFAATIFLIFCMGVSLGGRPHFAAHLINMGWVSFLYAAIPILFSILFVYIVAKVLFKGEKS